MHRLFMAMICMPFFHSLALAQEKTPITLDWLFSREYAALTALPTVQWTSDGSLIIYDIRQPAPDRIFEVYHPAKKTRRSLFDMKAAVEQLRFWLGDDAPVVLPWPVAFNEPLTKALYVFQDDLFVLDIPSNTFRRITQTDAEEKSPRFAPDGMKIAYVRNHDLYVYDLAGNREIRLTQDGSETILNGTLSWIYWEEIFDREDTGYWWSPDSRSIAFLQADEAPVAVTRWIDIRPVIPKEILQRYPKAGGANPKVRVGVADVASQSVFWLRYDTAGCEYVVRVNWLPDSRRVALQTLNRAQTTLKLFFSDASGGPSPLILTETDSAWVDPHYDLVFLKDGKHFLWTSERTGFNHIYRYTMDGAPVNAVTRGPWAVQPHRRNESIVAVDEKKGLVYFTALEKSAVERHLYRVGLDGKKLQRLSAETGVHEVYFSPDNQYYTDRFSYSAILPALALHKNDGTRVEWLAESRTADLQKYPLSFPEYFTIPARDSFPMPALIYKPAGFDPNKKYPLIFYVYGGPSAPAVSRGWDRYIWYNQLLLNEGYLVTVVDNRSATGISKALAATVLKKQASDGELNDLLDAVAWYKKQSWIDSSRIGIWGASGGGTFTLLGMTRSDAFKAGIAVAAVTDWNYYDTKYAERTMKTPTENPDGYRYTSLLQYAKNLHGRLMIIHGTYDDNVHPQQIWLFIDELIKVNKTFDSMFYPMRKHGVSDPPGRKHYYKTMIEFWKKNL